MADARRTGKSQDVEGVTLADEGVAGARIDAESHVLIEVEINRPAYAYPVASSRRAFSFHRGAWRRRGRVGPGKRVPDQTR